MYHCNAYLRLHAQLHYYRWDQAGPVGEYGGGSFGQQGQEEMRDLILLGMLPSTSEQQVDQDKFEIEIISNVFRPALFSGAAPHYSHPHIHLNPHPVHQYNFIAIDSSLSAPLLQVDFFHLHHLQFHGRRW